MLKMYLSGISVRKIAGGTEALSEVKVGKDAVSSIARRLEGEQRAWRKINWFQNPYAGVSAHYVIRSRDGYRAKTCSWKDIAWHAGNWSYNQPSIGIEHEGFVFNPNWFSDAMYRSSAYLSASLGKRYRIPIDRYHIIGHN